jgi:ADP-ribose pyrophosphatase YjhB (NUDIX family)
MKIIFFNEIAIYFTHVKSSEVDININVSNKSDISKVVTKINNGDFNQDINLHGYNASVLFNDFCQFYKYIEAAGGVIKNNQLDYLLIKRFDIWDLPKGKIEKGETVLEAAKREVCEETGLHQVTIINTLPDTFHVYEHKGRWILKKTYWYSMETQEYSALIPQLSEAITEAVWMSKSDAYNALTKSYRSLFDTLGFIFT